MQPRLNYNSNNHCSRGADCKQEREVEQENVKFKAFPYVPYDIQKQFMAELYGVLQDSSLGIFESPTGTGKSLSIICSAVQWLKDNENNLDMPDEDLTLTLQTSSSSSQQQQQEGKKEEQEDEATSTSTNEDLKMNKKPEIDDWMMEAYQKMQEKKKAVLIQETIEKRKQQQRRLERLSEALEHVPPHQTGAKKRKTAQSISGGSKSAKQIKTDKLNNKHDLSFIDEMIRKSEEKQKEGSEADDSGDEFCLAEYESDEDEETNGQGKGKHTNSERNETKKFNLRALIEDDSQDDDEEEDPSLLQVRKIYYCSRTHSQLKQFVGEIKKTQFGSNLRVVSLGSRKNLCINPDVKKLSVQSINDRCLDMQKQKTIITDDETESKDKKKVTLSKCPFYDASSQKLYRDHVLLKVRDIEELVSMGEKQRACPYYGTRAAIASAELVALPYNMLLHKSTRESLGIELKGNVVVVDEAHNLVDAINEMYSTQLSLAQLGHAESQLLQYQQRYRNRLKAKNLSYIKQILYIIRSLVKFLHSPSLWPSIPVSKSLVPNNSTEDKAADDGIQSQICTINDFLFKAKIDNLNLFKIEKYIQRSEIVKKLHGFVEKQQSLVEISEEEDEDHSRHRPALGYVEAFLLSLTNSDSDGRILLNHDKRNMKRSSLRFLLLNATAHFQEVASAARAVVLAGGTMQPISDLILQLFGVLSTDPKATPSLVTKLQKIHNFSCGHVIPKENLLALCVGSGPTGKPFDFTFANRSAPALIEELGRLVLNMCNTIPDGVVIFFPSYQYEEQVISAWTSSGILPKIQAKKKLFREPRNSSKIGDVLKEYKACIRSTMPSGTTGLSATKGAILSAVVGGKMSEGINFSDGLGRCVLMVGLPYPNPRDPILVEKLRYINEKASSSSCSNSSSVSSSHFYENLCMRAVNQSIGRAIRHAGDYATILLVDHRYVRREISSKLPQWIAASMEPPLLPTTPSLSSSASGQGVATPLSFHQAFGKVRSFFQHKKEQFRDS